MSEKQKKGGHQLCFEENNQSCPEEHLNLSKLGFLSEEDHSTNVAASPKILQLEL